MGGPDIFTPTYTAPVVSVSDNDPVFGTLKDGSFSGSVSLAKVGPNGFYDFKFHVGVLKDCATNEVYTIVVKRMVGTNFMVTSNPLRLKIVPGKWEPSEDDFVFPWL